MKIQNPLSGPKPLMISSLVSPDFVSELLGQDTSRLLKKGSECFESLSMNGKSSMISKLLGSS
jgi:hypothetical protein